MYNLYCLLIDKANLNKICTYHQCVYFGRKIIVFYKCFCKKKLFHTQEFLNKIFCLTFYHHIYSCSTMSHVFLLILTFSFEIDYIIWFNNGLKMVFLFKHYCLSHIILNGKKKKKSVLEDFSKMYAFKVFYTTTKVGCNLLA